MAKKKFNLKFSSRVTDHFINAVLIFASVFLAFWMNEIRKENDQIDYTKNAKMVVLSELKSNLSILERWTPYHKDILEKGVKFILPNIDTIEEFSLSMIPGLDKGIQREIITNSGKGFLIDNQVNFDIQTKMLINRIYDQQKYVTDATSRLTDNLLNQREIFDKNKSEENYLMFYALLGELWGQENAMIAGLKKTIQELER